IVMSRPSARAAACHRHAEHTVVAAVIPTAASTACQVTAPSPARNGAPPTCRHKNHRTARPAAGRRNGGTKRRTAPPIVILVSYGVVLGRVAPCTPPFLV